MISNNVNLDVTWCYSRAATCINKLYVVVIGNK
jgi:hypothetical protein